MLGIEGKVSRLYSRSNYKIFEHYVHVISIRLFVGFLVENLLFLSVMTCGEL